MINFYRNILDGPLYYIIAVISVIFIMAIIGFFLEKKQHAENKMESIESIPDTEIKPNENAATNADIPEVLNFNAINQKEEPVSNNQFVPVSDPEQIPEIPNTNSENVEEIPSVIDFNQIPSQNSEKGEESAQI